MNIKRFFILIGAITFIVINCNPVFSSDSVSVMGEVYHGDDREIDSLEQELKSPQDIGNAPIIKLNEDNLKAKRAAVSYDSVPNQIGFAQLIESLSERQRFKKILNWREIQDGGHTATIIISSSEAKALRIGIIVNKLPQKTEFRFFKINNRTSGLSATLITGRQINHLLQLNKNADPDHPDSQTYWSPTVAGESIGIEIYLPPGIHPDNLDIAIPFLSHFFVSPFVSSSEYLKPQSYGDSDFCQNDATCFLSWQDMATTVAKMVYTKSGSSYTCTGTLLNDADPSSWIPYFITANHCIGSQTVASTLETHWFYESAWCNSTTRNWNYTTRYGGAKLLWTKGKTTSSLDSNQDVSFLQLNDNLPSGVYYAGWNSTIGSGTVTCIHHPAGDWKKISFGNQGRDYKCYDTYSGYFNCSPSSTGSFLLVDWTGGGIESGSSGSGLFLNDQLIGILLGGSGSCAGSISYYSKFGASYSAGNFSQWLDPTPCTTPSNPTDFNASDDTYTYVNLTWSAVSGATSYDVYRSDISNKYTKIKTTTNTGFNDTSASAGVQYWYFVRARNLCGISGLSNLNPGKAKSNSCTTPSNPANLNASDDTYTYVNLTWSAVSGATSYDVYRSDISNKYTKIKTTTNTGFNDTSASAGVQYWYFVRARNLCGISGLSNLNPGKAKSNSCTTPSNPTNFNASDDTYAYVNLTWSAVLGATSYDVYRSDISNKYTKIKTTTNTGFNDTSASAGVQYWYFVRARNLCGISGLSNLNPGKAKSNSCTTPSNPTNFNASDDTYAYVNLTWSAVSGATSYDVYRSDISNKYTKIKTTTNTGFNDTSASAGVQYWYFVRARNLCGISGLSNLNPGMASGSCIGNFKFVYKISSTWTDRITMDEKGTTMTSDGTYYYYGYDADYPTVTVAVGAWYPSLSKYLILSTIIDSDFESQYEFSINADNTLSGIYKISSDGGSTWSSGYSFLIPESYKSPLGSWQESKASKNTPIDISKIFERKMAEITESQVQLNKSLSPIDDDLVLKINELKALLENHR